MIYNISYRDRKLDREISEHLGKPFGWFERIKLQGTGSQRFVLKNADETMLEKIGAFQGQMYCNIELRREGLILYFRSRIETYALVIPYYELAVSMKSNELTLQSDMNEVILTPANGAQIHLTFYKKLMELGNRALECGSC